MVTVNLARFRFYEELNEFLSPRRRKREFPARCAEHATVKNAIEAVGVPHTEVEVILVNGVSVGFDHRIEEGDRISVFPMFETLDVRPLLRLRPEPLRISRFIADAHVGRLVRYLRMLGFDTLYDSAMGDRQLVEISVHQRRILLTRDRELLMHRELTHGIFVHGDQARHQVRYVLDRLHLDGDVQPLSRCVRCNEELERVARQQIVARVPARVAARHRRFQRCPGCDRVYWRGTHHDRMMALVARLLEAQSAGPGAPLVDRAAGRP